LAKEVDDRVGFDLVQAAAEPLTAAMDALGELTGE
jgi:hypothetical protein